MKALLFVRNVVALATALTVLGALLLTFASARSGMAQAAAVVALPGLCIATRFFSTATDATVYGVILAGQLLYALGLVLAWRALNTFRVHRSR
jgi:hypothetical protein